MSWKAPADGAPSGVADQKFSQHRGPAHIVDAGPTQVRDGFLQGACEAPTAFVPTLKVALVNRRCNCMQCVGLVAVPAHVVLVVTRGSVAIVVSST